MSGLDELETCLICSKKNNIMVPLQEILVGCEEFSVAEVLENLQFLRISDSMKFERSLCFICVSKIQYCFEFKALCCQSEDLLKTQTDNINDEQFDASSLPSIIHIKEEQEDHNSFLEVTVEEDPIEYSSLNRFNENDNCGVSENMQFEENPFRHRDDAQASMYNTIHSMKTNTYKGETFNMGHVQGYHTNGPVNDYASSSQAYDIPHSSDSELQCNSCGKSFRSQAHLNKHVLCIHKSKMKFPCNVCQKNFESKRELKKHFKIHTESNNTNKTYNEPFIWKMSYTNRKKMSSYFLNHDNNDKTYTQRKKIECIQAMRSNKNKFVCPICQKVMKYKKNLLPHMRLHTGEKPYTCGICRESFFWSSSLTKHKIRVHKLPE